MRADLANTTKSSRLDASVKMISETLELEGFTRRSRLGSIYGIQIPCEPDGGLFFREDGLVAAFEAKHQGAAGNAIERWWKNYWFLINTYPMMRYITFLTGEGAKKGNVMYKLFDAHMQIEGKEPHSFNKTHQKGASFYINITNGKDMRDIMINSLTM